MRKKQLLSKVTKSSFALLMSLGFMLPTQMVHANASSNEIFQMEFGDKRQNVTRSYVGATVNLSSTMENANLSVDYESRINNNLIMNTFPNLKILNKHEQTKFHLYDMNSYKVILRAGTLKNNKINIGDAIDWPTTYPKTDSDNMYFTNNYKRMFTYQEPGLVDLPSVSFSSVRTRYVGNGKYRLEDRGTRFQKTSNIQTWVDGYASRGATSFDVYSNDMIVLSNSFYTAARKNFNVTVIRGNKDIYFKQVVKGKNMGVEINNLQNIQFQNGDKIMFKDPNGKAVIYKYNRANKNFIKIDKTQLGRPIVTTHDIIIKLNSNINHQVMNNGIEAYDSNGKDISNKVVLEKGEGNVPNRVGSYTRKYQVTDHTGRTSYAKRVITIKK